MSNAMTHEEHLKEIIDTMKEQVAAAATEAMDKFYLDRLPYIETDTACNVEHRAAEAVEYLLAGRFERKGDYVHINGLPVRIAITENQYDNLRKSMLEVMPACPKDAEIASLKAQLAEAYRRRY